MPASDSVSRPSRVENDFTPPPARPPESTGRSGGPPPTDHLLPWALVGESPTLPEVPGYRLLEVIGRGGMGTVYRAVHLAAEREVALKLVHSAGHNEAAARRRFEREVRALARLEDPNVMPVYEVGAWQGFPFYTMKYLPRGTLEQHLERFRGDLPAACRLLAKVARAVHRVHEAGILHRDLKPENILLDAGDEPLVADFGLSLCFAEGTDLSASGWPVGTRQYMAPEQTLGRKADYGPATDVWAIGVILYELIAGRRPFGDAEGDELSHRIRESPAPSAGALNPGCPTGLEAITRRCLAKRPCDRYPSAGALADDLERWATGVPVAAPPARPRRTTAWVAVFAGLTAAGVAAVVISPSHDPAGAPGVDAPAQTVAVRLARGETVELIGQTGLPPVAPLPVDGAPGVLSAAREGFCTFACLRYAAADLVREDVPLPVCFEAEVAVSRGDGPQSWVAAYAGRKEYRGSSGFVYSQPQVAIGRTRTPLAVGQVSVAEAVSAESYWWSPTAGGTRAEVGRLNLPRREQAAFPTPLVWRRVSITLRADEAVVLAADHEVATVRADELLRLGNGFVRRGWLGRAPVPSSPAFGVGIGICVNNSEGVYRNARLIPLTGRP